MEDVIMSYLNTPIDELHNKTKKLRQVMKRFDKSKIADRWSAIINKVI